MHDSHSHSQQLQAERDEARAQRDEARAQRDEARAQRDITAACERALAERDNAERERDALRACPCGSGKSVRECEKEAGQPWPGTLFANGKRVRIVGVGAPTEVQRAMLGRVGVVLREVPGAPVRTWLVQVDLRGGTTAVAYFFGEDLEPLPL